MLKFQKRSRLHYKCSTLNANTMKTHSDLFFERFELYEDRHTSYYIAFKAYEETCDDFQQHYFLLFL